MSTPADDAKPSTLVAEEVRAHMGRRRISQAALAEKLQISTSSMSRRLQGDSEFTVSELYAMARIFGISPVKLLGERTEAATA